MSCLSLKAFFARQSPEECERIYESLCEEEYLLKKHANLSLIEISGMSAETRKWWLKRIKRDKEEEQEAANKERQKSPSVPKAPRIPRK